MMGLLSALVTAGAVLIGLVILGVIFLLGVRLVRPSSPSPRGGDPDEAQLLQEIHRSLGRLETRIETLETLVLDSRSKGNGPCDT
jgi:phage shock protein B